MRVGIHAGQTGGYAGAVERVARAGCTAMQIFSANPRSYRTAPIDAPALREFARLRDAAGIEVCVIHTPYLVNLASADPKIATGSSRLIRHDLEFAAQGAIRIVNTHLGSYGDRDRAQGFSAVVAALTGIGDAIAPGVQLVLENSAGAGNLAGGTLEELGAYLRAVDHPQIGVCLDTAHAWAAGYAIDTAAGVERFLEQADAEIGFDRIVMFHLNDTQVPLGGARDRHWHIGEGSIGFDGFRALLAHPELREKPAILETPGDEADDLRNVATVLAIARGAR